MPSAVDAGGPVTILFFAAASAWWISELVGAAILPRWRAGRAPEVAQSDRGSRLAIVLGIFSAVIILFATQPFAVFPLPFLYAGEALLLIGIALRQWAIAVLGRFFSTSVRAVEGHRLVTRGPYRLVRHPSYSGLLLCVVGFGLAGGSWPGFLAMVGIVGAAVGYRIRVEERFLVEQFGARYRDYQRSSKRLVPFLW